MNEKPLESNPDEEPEKAQEEQAPAEDSSGQTDAVEDAPSTASEEAAAEPEPVKASANDDAPTAEEQTESTETEDEEFEEERPRIVTPPPDDGIARRWYAIHAHSGQEGTVQKALLARAEKNEMQNLITNVLVPMEEVAEFKSGEKRLSKRKYFPGYVLVQLPEHPEKNPDLWHLIKDTPGVTGFIGSRTEPVPLDTSEVDALVEEMRGERERPRAKVAFEIGERVKIIDGPFANFMGTIGEIDEESGKLKVMIEIFERQTSVEVEFWQVEKN